MRAAMQDSTRWNARHFPIGGSPETSDRLSARLPILVPGIDLVGVVSPPFRPMTEEEHRRIERDLLATRSTYLQIGVGLGTPQQDYFVSAWLCRVPAVFLAVGAAFDFLSGNKREAPNWLHDTGLEWTFPSRNGAEKIVEAVSHR